MRSFVIGLCVFYFYFDVFGFYTYNYKSKPNIKINTTEWKVYSELTFRDENRIGLFFVKSF